MSDERLDDLERRVARLEEALALRRQPVLGEPPPAVGERFDLALAGRTLIGLGGAYLLRAVTDAHVVPPMVGIAAGMAYALAWIVIADRQASGGNRRAAHFDAALATMIAFPIVWEATVRFHVLDAWPAAALAIACATALLAVAARRDLQAVAWMASAGVVVTATGLAYATRTISAPLVSVAAAGAITWWLSERRHWPFVAWLTAIETDLLGVVALVLVLLQAVHDDVPMVIAALLAAFVAYIVVARSSNVQSCATTLIHLTAALILAQRFPIAGAVLPLFVIAGALVVYRSIGPAALMMMLVATGFLGQPGITWGALAVAAAILVVRLPSLAYHAAVYAVAAGAGAGLLLASARVFAGLGPGESPLTPARMVTFAAIVAATVIARQSEARVVLIGNLAFLAIGIAGALVSGTDPGWTASGRTMIIGAAAVALAYLDLRVLVYPLLVAGGIKMLLEDFRTGRPATLFVTLAFYGLVLVIVARLRTRGGLDTPLPDTDRAPEHAQS